MAYSYREPRGPLRASFFNLPRGTTGYVLTLLEQIKDGLMYVGKYRSKQREIGPTHVVVFANQPPPEGFVSEDRLRVRYIKREDPPEDEPVFTRDHAQEEDAPPPCVVEPRTRGGVTRPVDGPDHHRRGGGGYGRGGGTGGGGGGLTTRRTTGPSSSGSAPRPSIKSPRIRCRGASTST